MWRYRNPVKVVFGAGSFEELRGQIDGRSYAVVTYGEAIFAALTRRIEEFAGPALLVIDDVAPNPDFVRLGEQTVRFARLARAPQVVVALGGGSVINSAKVFAAARGDFGRVRRFLETKGGAEALGAMPIIAVPTTAGTGSEVTSWATVWDEKAGRKYSLNRPNLYPEAAIVDPALMTGKPRELTVATGLDALSHALESLWNVNANPISAAHAVAAARATLDVLPKLAADLGDLDLRTRMAQAALQAGLAFSNTQTAIAHSLSYPITLHHRIQHGIACSFSLPVIMESVVGSGGPCEESLKAIFGLDLHQGVKNLDAWLASLGISTRPAAFGIGKGEWSSLVEDALAGERGLNFAGSKAKFLSLAAAM